jgi:hypothetical protein
MPHAACLHVQMFGETVSESWWYLNISLLCSSQDECAKGSRLFTSSVAFSNPNSFSHSRLQHCNKSLVAMLLFDFLLHALTIFTASKKHPKDLTPPHTPPPTSRKRHDSMNSAKMNANNVQLVQAVSTARETGVLNPNTGFPEPLSPCEGGFFFLVSMDEVLAFAFTDDGAGQ